ncbi:MAG: YggT family protein [Anaerolineales bacterium]|nr:YggT family protein [Anaerolineales bacterium]MCL4257187.1 YggT family protein [Anaerolineales bacterium]QYK50528.1 MAG: YggT family protein [Anaerolineales bacterium]
MEQAIALIFDILSWIVIIDVVLGYFMDPYHPLRRALDRIVEPMLAPIRRLLPPTGMLDFSPLILLILLQLLSVVVINAFR